jgi:flavodoxin I
MAKTAVVYWSGTGNTEQMAQAVAEGAKSAGAECTLVSVSEFDESILPSLTGIAFGCPAMGAEVLEEAEFQPFWDSVSGKLGGKKVALFGSYGWGDGEWMRSWEEDCANNGVQLATESVICNDAPDDAALDSCKALGAAIAS